MFKKLLRQNFIFIGFGIGILLSFGLFFKTFSAYYFQDDWFSLEISRISNFIEFLNFLKPRPDIVYFRPLGMQIPFFLMQSLFGLNPLPFKILTYLIHLLNGYVIYLILNKLFNNQKLSLYGVIIYLTSSIHLTVFYWSATFAFILGPLFYFLGFYFYLLKKPKFTWLLFILGLLTNEMIISLPVTILLWETFYKKKITYNFIFGFLLLVIYFGWRMINVGLPFGGAYRLSSEILPVIKNFRNYVLWTLNWPEEIQNQFISFLSLNRVFIKEFSGYILFFLVNSVFIIGIVITTLVKYLFFNHNENKIIHISLFGSLWFIVCLVPVLFFSNHAYAYYLPIPFFGILILILSSWQQLFKNTESKKSYLIIAIFLSVWILSSWKNIIFNYDVHWAPRRAKISKAITGKLLTQYPILPDNSVIVIPKNDENKWALGDQNALKYLYWNQNIATFYGNSVEAQKFFTQNEKTTIYKENIFLLK